MTERYELTRTNKVAHNIIHRIVIPVAILVVVGVVIGTMGDNTKTTATTSQPVGTTAAVVRKQYTAADIPAIVEASRHNEMKFNRDYYQQQLNVRGEFESARAAMIGDEYLITYSVGVERVYCAMLPPSDLADWPRGAAMNISGTIYTTTLGQVKLDHCKLTP
jgi:hypothetical protein